MTLEEIFVHPHAVAAIIDHTLLKPDATRRDVAQLCAEAQEFSFASVCIHPCWVRLAAESLSGSRVRVCTVIGFPLGANKPEIKLREAELALVDGATELDMVQNVGALKSGELETVQHEISSLARLAHSQNALLKVILETSLLTQEEILTACRLAVDARADFVKTSTGFSSAGATPENVKFMRTAVGTAVGVKASGGVRSLESLHNMVAAGANRIGTSSGVAILRAMRSSSEASGQKNSNGEY